MDIPWTNGKNLMKIFGASEVVQDLFWTPQEVQGRKYHKVKLDGLPIPKGSLVKDPYFCQDVGTVSHLLLDIWYPLKKPKETQRSGSSGSFWM